VISATPAAMLRPESSSSSRWNHMTGSSGSLAESGLVGSITPTLSRRNNSNPFSRAMEGFGTLTRSTGRNAFNAPACLADLENGDSVC
jgi:hypothetical protein